jgi:hypothetical protein
VTVSRGLPAHPPASAPALGAVIGLQDPARQDRAIGLQTLADHDQAELIQAAERGQVRAAEGSVRHVEVFQMGGVGTSILGRPRHLPRDRRASHHPTSDYTLNCEEPQTADHAALALNHRKNDGVIPGVNLEGLQLALAAVEETG